MDTENNPEAPESASGVFLRKSSGLVREAGLFDTIFYNWVAAGAVGLALVYNLYWALNAFPGVDLVTATLLTVPFAICGVIVFALLASAMPRSGGDYVFVSRVIHPVWGFVSSWMGFISVVAYTGYVAWFTSVAFVPAALGVLAGSNSSSPLLELSTWATSSTGSLVVGLILIAASAGVMVAGLKFTLRTISYLAIGGFAGLIVSAIVLVSNGRDGFITKFNAFADPIAGGTGTYHSIIQTAADAGLPAVSAGSASFSGATLPTVVISFYAIGYAVWSIYFAGEIKGARDRRRQVLSMGIPTVLNLLVFIGMFKLLFRTVGYEFMNASSYLYNWVPDLYPLQVPPFPPFFVSLLSDSAILNFIVAVTWLVWPIAMLLLIMVGFSRVLFAWSFDGVMPKWLGDVNPRTHAPVKAILVSAVLSAVALWLLVNTAAFLTFLAYTVVLALFFWISMALAGILLPYRLRSVYEASAAKWEIGGIPVISMAGVVLFLFVLFEFYAFFKYEGLGIYDKAQAVQVVVAVMAVGGAIFGASYLSKKRNGNNLMLVYKEIPPE